MGRDISRGGLFGWDINRWESPAGAGAGPEYWRLGAKVVMPKTPVPTMGWFAQLKDTEGNIFAIWQHDAAAA